MKYIILLILTILSIAQIQYANANTVNKLLIKDIVNVDKYKSLRRNLGCSGCTGCTWGGCSGCSGC